MVRETNAPCNLCQGVIHQIRESSELGGLPQQKLEWHPGIGQLQISAKSCSLCSCIWDLSLSQSYSRAQERLGGAIPQSSSPITLKFGKSSKANGIFWAVLSTQMLVKELGLDYNHIDTIGISSLPMHEALSHPNFWQFGKANKHKTFTEDRNATLKEWLRDCESHHEICQPAVKRYPTRILLVQPGEPLRIVPRDQIPQGEDPVRYATLSHAWGKHMPLRTTKETKSEFEKCIPEELLPRTFQDAVSTTRALGIHYLWIDSLCIVQDDPQDWQTEAFEMQHIYSGGTINIAASDALDSTGGCFGQNRSESIGNTPGNLRIFYFQDENDSRSTMIRFHTQTPREVQRWKHLSTRGWVLQEEVLSHRIIHCSESELYWQCKCSYKTQSGQNSDPSAVLRHPADWDLEPSRREERIWYEWIEDYAMRDFTFLSDRMAAIAGIASYYQQLTGYSPLLGSWKESFTDGLLWIRIGPMKTAGPLGIPTWTWLSCNAPVIFGFWRESLSEDWKTTEDHVILCTCDITWTGLAYVSNVQCSALVIKGPVKSLCLRIAPKNRCNPPYFEVEGEELDFSKPIPWSWSGQFDDEAVRRDKFTTYTCLLVRSVVDPQGELRRETFLILELVAGVSDGIVGSLPTYRRIGIGSIQSKTGQFSLADEARFMLC